MGATIWQKCLNSLEGELTAQQFNTWIKPLQAELDTKELCLLAPNKYIRDQVSDMFLARIQELVDQNGFGSVTLRIGSSAALSGASTGQVTPRGNGNARVVDNSFAARESFYPLLKLNTEFTFETFVAGRSNELARAAAIQVSENVGVTYKCLLLYGGVGLGKTHLMHAVGNAILEKHPHLKVAYMYSQRFMEDMVRAIEHGTMSEFTQYYRTVDVLLMDDIQFLAKGMKSQEEFFHVFNRLQENGSQIVLTCDRYPKEIEGLEERLKSRFMWGMTATVEPPDLETRVAILLKKA